MKNFFSNRIVLAVLFFVIGGATDLTLNKYMNKKNATAHEKSDMSEIEKSHNFFDNFYNEDFFGKSKDPFEEMRRMQGQMLKQLPGENNFQDSFDSWYQNKFGGEMAELKQSEDEHFIYYDLDLKDQVPKNVKVEVKNHQINISAETETHTEDKNSSSSYSSSFRRSLPTPSGVDADKYEIEQQDKKIRIKFPKLKT